jgi:aminoglycoside phosphotransferase (APT) family kinase protein
MNSPQLFAAQLGSSDLSREASAALDAWLRGNLPDFAGINEMVRFEGGQSNPTYLVRDHGGREYVVRRKPSGSLLPSAHAVDREHRVLCALQNTAVPVPRALALCLDTTIVGSEFYVMEFVPGRIFWDPALPEIGRDERAAVYDEMNHVQAALHNLEPAALGLGDFGKPGEYLRRQMDRWIRQYRASETEPIEAMEALIDWLPTRPQREGRVAVVHGDFKLQNMLFHPSEPRIVAVLDWELSTLGDPLVDFAYHCMIWRLPPALWSGLAGLDLVDLGVPSEAEFVARYCQRTGQEAEDWDFYVIFCMFRLAAILQGIMQRALKGNAASAAAREYGSRTRGIAEVAWREAQKISGKRA